MAFDEPYKTRALHSLLGNALIAEGHALLWTPHLMNFEPEAIAELGLNRRKEVLPQMSFCKLRVPSGLNIA